MISVRAAIAAGVVFLTAGMINVSAAPLPKLGEGIANDHGLVVMTVVNNNRSRENKTFNVTVSDKRGKQFHLQSVASGFIATGLFLGHLPEGTYRLESMLTYNRAKAVEVKFKRELGTFKVRDGRVTSLGSIVYYQYNARQNRAIVTRKENIAELRRIIDGLYPSLLPLVAERRLLRWRVSRKQTVAAKRLLKKVQAMSTHLHQPADGRGGVFAGGRLGQFKYRGRGGKWKYIDTGYSWELYGATALDNGIWLTGGEGGVLLKSKNRGKSWQEVRRVDARSVITHVGQTSEGWVYVVSYNGHLVNVWRISNLNSPEWKLVGQFPYEAENGLAAHSQLIRLFNTEKDLVLTLSHDRVHRYRFASRRWERSKSAKAFLDVSYANGVLYADMPGNDVIHSSTDLGKTWRPFARIRGLKPHSAPQFMDSDKVFVKGQIAATGKHALYLSSNGGKGWEKVAGLPTRSSVVFDSDQHLYVAVSGGRKIYRSPVGQRRWTLDFKPRIN